MIKGNSKTMHQIANELSNKRKYLQFSISQETEENEFFNGLTQYCSELYNHKIKGNSAVQNYLDITEEDNPANFCEQAGVRS